MTLAHELFEAEKPFLDVVVHNHVRALSRLIFVLSIWLLSWLMFRLFSSSAVTCSGTRHDLSIPHVIHHEHLNYFLHGPRQWLDSFHQGGGCAVSPSGKSSSVEGLVELLLPQESVRGTPDATWLLGPGEAKIYGALHTQLRGFTLALFMISASRRVYCLRNRPHS